MIVTPPRMIIYVMLGLVGFMILLPHIVPSFYITLVAKVMILAIFAMSLDLLMGYTGLVSFGHAAFFGVGGYALAMIAPESEAMSLFLSLPGALIATGLVALVIGWFCIRTSGVYFIMVTLAFAQMLYYLTNDTTWFGGSDGRFVNFRPTLSIFGFEIFDISSKIGFYYVVLASLVLAYLFLRMLLDAPFGRTLMGIKVNEHRMRALGYATDRYKLVAFVVAGMLAGLAGYLNAAQFGFVNPADLSWRHSGEALMFVILGGLGTLFGPVIGTFLMVLFHDFVSELTEHWHVFMGVFVIAVVLLMPNGVAGLLLKLGARRKEAGNEQ
jgi:branched-chain amino acid transport system permease protein